MVKLEEEAWAGPPVCHPWQCSHDTGLCYICLIVCVLFGPGYKGDGKTVPRLRDGLACSNELFRLHPGCGA